MKKKIGRERIFYIFMTLFVGVIIFLFSSVPNPEGGGAESILSTIYHFGVFFMFAFFLSLSFKGGRLDRNTVLVVVLISLAYAISDEIHQIFVVGRFASVKDVVVDLIGSLSALLTLKIVSFYKKI